MAVAGDVARPSRTSADLPRSLDHGIDDGRMASHAEIVV